MELEQLHKEHARLEVVLQSIEMKARAMRNEVKILKEQLTTRRVEEELCTREFSTFCGEKAGEAPCDSMSEPEADETECMSGPVTLDILREVEILSDTEGRHIVHLAGVCLRD
ncbi:hypothetical protein GWN49_07140 [Candidatus Bathyarchaeota archaeon]|nr:hypothetical protein [Candidatus Bathyarchaeota archaeon]